MGKNKIQNSTESDGRELNCPSRPLWGNSTGSLPHLLVGLQAHLPPAPRFHPLAASSFWKHFPSTWTSQGGGAWQGLCSRWPRIATAEVESNSVAKGNSGCVPDKLNPSSDLKGKSRLKEIRGKEKGQGNPAGGQECTCKPRPSERVQRHIDESRRDNKNACFF